MSSFLGVNQPSHSQTYAAGQDSGELANFAMEIARQRRIEQRLETCGGSMDSYEASPATSPINQIFGKDNSVSNLPTNNLSSLTPEHHSSLSNGKGHRSQLEDMFVDSEYPARGTHGDIRSDASAVQFDHSFSGVSVWIEFDEEGVKPYQQLIDRIQKAANEPSFQAHATVLYNIEPELLRWGDEECVFFH